MSAREIPRWQWPAFLDQFSRTHRAWLATLDEDDEATAHPLRSVTPFVHNNRVVHIDIRFQDDPHGREPARIHSPVSVHVHETTEGIAQGLEIVDDKGRATRLRFLFRRDRNVAESASRARPTCIPAESAGAAAE